MSDPHRWSHGFTRPRCADCAFGHPPSPTARTEAVPALLSHRLQVQRHHPLSDEAHQQAGNRDRPTEDSQALRHARISSGRWGRAGYGAGDLGTTVFHPPQRSCFCLPGHWTLVP